MPIYIGGTAVNKIYVGSTEVQSVYIGSTLVHSAFEDGSLVIQDDTLDVAEGSNINLRVKLGAKPGSNVVVAASESIDGISVTASRTFTQANWDVYQSFVVTGTGNTQTFVPAPSGTPSVSVLSTRAGLSPQPGDNTLIAPAFIEGGVPAYLRSPNIMAANNPNNPREVRLRTVSADGSFDIPGDAGPNMTPAWEGGANAISFVMGAVAVTVSGPTGPGITPDDTEEPYVWLFPSSLDSDVADLVAAVFNASDTERRANFSVILRDYTLGSGTINLAASGPDEYDGVTGSATVTVTVS